jgi:hypothetical protein
MDDDMGADRSGVAMGTVGERTFHGAKAPV